jgi:hypothetical protein
MRRLLLVICVLSMGSLARAQTAPSLGAAATFAVLGSSNVTCTAPGVISGDVGVSPGVFTNTTGCTIAGTVHQGDVAATNALAALTSAYNALNPINPMNCNATETGTLAGVTLPPGVYCFPAAATLTGTLTLDGSTNPNGIWIFEVGAALTGTSFQVVMANGAQACNVYWSVGAAVTLTDSLFQGNILAGATDGAITITRGSVIGRVLANGAVTLTGPSTGISIHGTCALVAQGGGSCPADDDDKHHHRDKDKDRDHDKDKDKDKDNNKDDNKDHN